MCCPSLSRWPGVSYHALGRCIPFQKHVHQIRAAPSDLLSDLLTFAEMHQCIWAQKQGGRKHTKFLLPFISSAFIVRQDFYYLGLSSAFFWFFFFVLLSFTLILLKLLSSFLRPASRVLGKSPHAVTLSCKTFFSTLSLEFLWTVFLLHQDALDWNWGCNFKCCWKEVQ